MQLKRPTKPAITLLLILCAGLLLAGCSGNPIEAVGNSIGEIGDAVNEVVGKLLSGDVTGKVGETYRTEWFNFTVHSIDEVASYAGYTAQDGYTLYDVKISETATFENQITMGTFDFFMDADVFEDYAWPLDAWDDSMMPESFELEPGESAEYHMVFEVPEGMQGLKLMYVEIDEADNVGATFTIVVN